MNRRRRRSNLHGTRGRQFLNFRILGRSTVTIAGDKHRRQGECTNKPFREFHGTLLFSLVLYTTNRASVGLSEVVQVRVVVVVEQEHVERVLTIGLRRTPEVRIVAHVVVIPNVVPVAGRQRRETESIRSVATIVPTSLRLENLARS